jgi:hypothetical protein
MEKWRYNSTNSQLRNWMEVSGQLHAPAALPWGRCPRHPLDRRLGGPQTRPGHGGEEKNSLPLLVIEPQSSSLQPNHNIGWAITAPGKTNYKNLKWIALAQNLVRCLALVLAVFIFGVYCQSYVFISDYLNYKSIKQWKAFKCTTSSIKWDGHFKARFYVN